MKTLSRSGARILAFVVQFIVFHRVLKGSVAPNSVAQSTDYIPFQCTFSVFQAGFLKRGVTEALNTWARRRWLVPSAVIFALHWVPLRSDPTFHFTLCIPLTPKHYFSNVAKILRNNHLPSNGCPLQPRKKSNNPKCFDPLFKR